MNKAPRGIKADVAYSYKKLEAVARSLRSYLGLSTTDKIDGLELFDKLPAISIDGISYGVETGVDILQGVEAEASFDAEKKHYQILLTPETYDLLEARNPHGTWVLVHEYAHVVLHGKLLQRLASMAIQTRAALYKGTPTPHSFFMDTEWQTDSLTAAFLMPAVGISHLEQDTSYRFMGLSPSLEFVVSIHFGTSLEAANYRVGTFRQRREELVGS